MTESRIPVDDSPEVVPPRIRVRDKIVKECRVILECAAIEPTSIHFEDESLGQVLLIASSGGLSCRGIFGLRQLSGPYARYPSRAHREGDALARPGLQQARRVAGEKDAPTTERRSIRTASSEVARFANDLV